VSFVSLRASTLFAAGLAAVALAAAAAVAWLTLAGFAWNDYDLEAAPAYLALVAGDLDGFAGLLPAYGGSLVLRAPFALATGALGGGELAVYRAVSAPCLLAVAATGAWIAAHAAARDTRIRLVVVLLFAANPLLLPALELGHPEEALGAALCVAAVLAAVHRRPTLAGALLGLAVANKAWAVLAVGPVLLALERGRLRALLVAGPVAAVLLAPLALGHAGGMVSAGAAGTGTIFKPWQAWWFLGEPGLTIREVGGPLEGYRTPPAWLSPLAHPLIVAVGGLLALAWRPVRRRQRPVDALLLLALVFLMRCLLDPWNNAYYCLPFLLALLAWEALARPRMPVLTLAATVLAWATFRWLNGPLGPDLEALSFLVWAVPLLGALAWMGYRPRERAPATVRRPAPRPAAA
jgi:hypothetical protein